MTHKELAMRVATDYCWPKDPSDRLAGMVERAIEAAVLEEREACAKLCEGESFHNDSDYSIACERLAKEIRARRAEAERRT